jgi:hypothetical protein
VKLHESLARTLDWCEFLASRFTERQPLTLLGQESVWWTQTVWIHQGIELQSFNSKPFALLECNGMEKTRHILQSGNRTAVIHIVPRATTVWRHYVPAVRVPGPLWAALWWKEKSLSLPVTQANKLWKHKRKLILRRKPVWCDDSKSVSKNSATRHFL